MISQTSLLCPSKAKSKFEGVLRTAATEWAIYSSSTKPADFEAAKELVPDLYATHGKTPPKFIFTSQGPYDAIAVTLAVETIVNIGNKDASAFKPKDLTQEKVRALADRILWVSPLPDVTDLLKDDDSGIFKAAWQSTKYQPDSAEQGWTPLAVHSNALEILADQSPGSSDAGFYGYYDLFRRLQVLDEHHLLSPLAELAKVCGGVTMYADVCVLQDRCEELHTHKNKLHNDAGPAVCYRDGLQVYANRGRVTRVRCPRGSELNVPIQ